MRIRESRGKVSRKTRRGPRGQKLWFNQSGDAVTIWQHTNQEGQSWILGEGTHIGGDAFSNDIASSINVPAGVKATLHRNMRTDSSFNPEDSVTINGPASQNLTDLDFNDQLSEIDVENMGTPDSDDSGSTQAPDITGITEFDWMCYGERYPDLIEAFGSDTEALKQHYIDYGASEGRDPYCPDSADQMTQGFPEDLSIAYIQDTFGDSSEDAQKIYDYANNYILTNDSWMVSTGNKAQENGRSISQQAMHEARFMLRQSGAIGGSDDDTMIADGMPEQKAGFFSGTTGMIILGIAFVGIGYAIYKRNRGGQV